MTYATRFVFRQRVRQSLWIVPLVGAVAGALLALALIGTGGWVTLPSSWELPPSTATAMLAAIMGASVGLVGFVVTVTVLMVQTAMGTFSARYMRLLYRDDLLKAVLAVLVGTMTYSMVLLHHVGRSTQQDLGVAASGVLMIAVLALFLVFFSRFLQRLRPVAVAVEVSRLGIATFAEGAPTRVDAAAANGAAVVGGAAVRIPTARPGTIQALDLDGLVEWARQRNGRIELRAGVGDFVPSSAMLGDAYGIADGQVREVPTMVAVGHERTIEQDPAFALRIMVDVAIRALSPAVNDPTTAVQVLNYVEEMLGVIGRHDFAGRGVHRDAQGVVRLVVPTREWGDYLSLGIAEIREYGASSLQVARRLRALLGDLRSIVRPEHVAGVDDELARLDLAVAGAFTTRADLDRAAVPDRQGLGAPSALAP